MTPLLKSSIHLNPDKILEVFGGGVLNFHQAFS